uniref:Uncharacterized protein n=1 Tax=Anguilla anguilla TaxID=7936 RepID=A0A0E9X0S2_ANGAN
MRDMFISSFIPHLYKRKGLSSGAACCCLCLPLVYKAAVQLKCQCSIVPRLH